MLINKKSQEEDAMHTSYYMTDRRTTIIIV
jgi:hypothetical protein